MTIEDDLADAMRAHVAGVRAAPGLGSAVRGQHRAHVLRLRAAGAALVTVAVAVAVAVPVALNHVALGGGDAAAGQDRVVVRDDVTVPDVTGKSAAQAARILREAGLRAEFSGVEILNNLVLTQRPPAGGRAAPGDHVRLTLAPRDRPPQDLGDLGDGREFGGIRLGYLPEGLVWGNWSAKDRFGKHSYTTGFQRPDADYGTFAVQVFVFTGEAARQAVAKFPGQEAERVDVGGRRAWLATVADGGEVVPRGTERGLLTIGWEVRDGLVVQVCLETGYSEEIDGEAELRRIAEGVRPDRPNVR
ncbi:PASTA domain-containing protein [Nonomuraea fuscirosea]|uniref:PASTA domain-containing protein n=1 Tax=Nonomuraea fuscirosea TaxID=1291556 RepID=UPI00341D7371